MLLNRKAMLRIFLVVAFAAICSLAGAEVQAAGVKVFSPTCEFSFAEAGDPGPSTLSASTLNYCFCEAGLIWGKSPTDLEYLYNIGELTIKQAEIGGVRVLIVNYSGAEIILVEPI